MNINLGIDIGGSTTKIIGLNNGKLIGTKLVRAADQMTALYGAIGSFLREHKISLNDVSLITLTGVGASFISKESIYDIKTIKVDEFQAIGRGARYLSKLNDILVVSMGTGTALVKATGSEITRIGGSGVGGGTILGLASQMLGKSDIDAIIDLASTGNLRNVDLMVGDIIGNEIPSLASDLTAANFGNIISTASKSDIALGIINMVFEVIGMLVVLALRNETISDVVLTGTLTTFPQAPTIFKRFEDMTGLNFIIPENAMFSTALGTALTTNDSAGYKIFYK